ncbi:hypothetical protein FIBSPDRAFT_850204, partial [Athelia psychrophila]
MSQPPIINLRARDPTGSSDPLPRKKPAPKVAAIPVPFAYAPSDDGTDENLLILLHGLGDTHVPFAKLGRSLKLPQTATLALRASEQVPFLYEDSYQWYPSFDLLGEVIRAPNPTIALDLLATVLAHLTDPSSGCGWPPERIHLFGFAQGGSVGSESAIQWWKGPGQRIGKGLALGSVTTVSGPLLSYPSQGALALCPTPLLVFHRPSSPESALTANNLAAFKKGFMDVSEVKFGGDGMPRAKDEWEPIMRFWSERLGRRTFGEGERGVYEVITG